MATPARKAASAASELSPSQSSAGNINGQPVPKAQTVENEQFGPQHFVKMLDLFKEEQKTQAEHARSLQEELRLKQQLAAQDAFEKNAIASSMGVATKLIAPSFGAQLGGIGQPEFKAPDINANALDLAQIPQVADTMKLIESMNQNKLLHEQSANRTKLDIANVNAGAKIRAAEIAAKGSWDRWRASENEKDKHIEDKYGNLQYAASNKLWHDALKDMTFKPMIEDELMGNKYSLTDLSDPNMDKTMKARLMATVPNTLVDLVSSGLPREAINYLKALINKEDTTTALDAMNKITPTPAQEELLDKTLDQIDRWTREP